MSDNSLPDEIISEILSPALKISDEIFSDNSDESPFAEYSESTSAYLLVCKAWLRVATPLLYNIVVLRSKAQAKALARALSKNQELGQFIKKLRVEGGYGIAMATILQRSPNISDPFLSLQIWASDNTDGLCKGLSFINPARVILRDSEYKRLHNTMRSNLDNALTKAIPKWDHLRIFGLPYTSVKINNIVQALVKSRRLQTIVIPTVEDARWVFARFKECPLEAIEIKGANLRRYALDTSDSEEEWDPELKALLRFPPSPSVLQDSDAIEIAPSSNPFFIPMHGVAEEVQDVIWKRILYFAMSLPELEMGVELKSIPPRLPLILVSKMFYRLGLPHLYAHANLQNCVATSTFVAVLQEKPFLGPQVRTLCGNLQSIVRYDSDSDSDDPDGSHIGPENGRVEEQLVVALLSLTPGLVRFYGWSLLKDFEKMSFLLPMELPISWAAFEMLATCSGSTLQEFSKRISRHQGASATIFNDFTQLRCLDWKCETTFDCSLQDASYDGLPSLEELRIWSPQPSFLIALSRMKLPSLQCLRLFGHDVTDFEAFFEAHGNKLTSLDIPCRIMGKSQGGIFDLCQNVSCIAITIDAVSEEPPKAQYFSPRAAHGSLEKIKFNMRYWSSQKGNIAKWETFFTAFEPKHFPNLRTIEVQGCKWPTTEREIAKSCWVQWAENLLKHDVNLVDENGKKWRRRLK
ncbi:hypothetical protein C8R44DRAFT_789994 [Mycena epipterygia]|nr:hypothetical protein C8R44DRAFT_789994 [Mycena epipterygia]